MSLYRSFRGLDSIDMGIYPADMEPTLFLWFTDGLNPTVNFHIEPKDIYYQDFYRWDQKLYTFLFSQQQRANEIHQLTDLLGGQVFYPTSAFHLHHMIENAFSPFFQKNSVVVHPNAELKVRLRLNPSICIELEDIDTKCTYKSWFKSSSLLPRHFPLPDCFPSTTNSNKRRGHPYFIFQRKKKKDEHIDEIPDGLRYTILDMESSSLLAREITQSQKIDHWIVS